jgi:hypothetical protein
MSGMSHMSGMSRMSQMNSNRSDMQRPTSPINGFEPDWNPEKWNDNKKLNNCYAYAMDDHAQSRDSKSIPGDQKTLYTCSGIMEGLKAEIPRLYVSTFHEQCQPGFTKIYAAVSDEDDENDFHFWRQDRDGMWSHKPGSSDPRRVDGEAKPIYNPDESNRNGTKRNYSIGCGFFCIPKDSRDG